jgi:hypothetical protein
MQEIPTALPGAHCAAPLDRGTMVMSHSSRERSLPVQLADVMTCVSKPDAHRQKASVDVVSKESRRMDVMKMACCSVATVAGQWPRAHGLLGRGACDVLGDAE